MEFSWGSEGCTQVLIPECPCSEWRDCDHDVTATQNFAVQSPPGTQVVSVTALCQVEKGGFLGLIAPKVIDECGLEALQCQYISHDSRKTILKNQGSLWADDEIAFALGACSAKGMSDQNVVVWPSIMLTSAVNNGDVSGIKAMTRALPEFATVVSAVVIEGHWNPIVWRITATEVLGFTCGLKHGYSMALQFIQGEICRIRAVESDMINNKQIGFVVDEFCGAMATCFVHHLLWGVAIPHTKELLKTHHLMFREEFESQLSEVVPRPWIWGQGVEPWEAKLSALLQEHGVPMEAVEDRVRFLKSKLGASNIEQALQTGQAWRELKWLANRSTPIVQLIKPSELQSVLDKKVKSGVSLGNRSQKQKEGQRQGVANNDRSFKASSRDRPFCVW